ncbi:MAG: cation:proton antiporter, partial [Rikenellaceae bacterium]
VYSLALLCYSFIELCDGNGILGVYIAGIIVGNANFARQSIIEKFFDGTTWIFQIGMFLTLGLLVFPSKVWDVAPYGLLVAVVLTFIARPIAVFISTMFFKMTFKDRIFISWCGLRGASPIIFATFPAVAGIGHSTLVFNIVFFVSILSVLVQGSTIAWLAGKLGLLIDDVPDRNVEIDLPGNNKSYSLDVVIEENSYAIGKCVDELVVRNGVVIMVEHDGECVTPHPKMVIKRGYKLYITSQSKEDNNTSAVMLCSKVH